MKEIEKKRITHIIDDVKIKENIEEASYMPCQIATVECLANNLNNELKEQKISQEDFAKKIEISAGALSSYRSGKRIPPADVLSRMSKELNVSSDYLLGLTELKNMNVDYKKIHKVTGLSDASIEALKLIHSEYINCDELFDKSVYKRKLNAINYLIANESNAGIFENVAKFLWDNYSTLTWNYEKDFNIKKNTNSDCFLGNVNDTKKACVEITELNSKETNIILGEKLNKVALLDIEYALNKLKENIGK